MTPEAGSAVEGPSRPEPDPVGGPGGEATGAPGLGPVLALVAVAVLVAAAVGMVASGALRADDDIAAPADLAGTVGGGTGEPAGESPGATTVPAPATVPAEPADAPGLGPGALRIGFDGPEGPLADVAGVGAWQQVAGRWVQQGGAATVAEPGEVRSLAVLPVATAPATVQVTLDRPADNGGLLARYGDPDNWVAAIALPSRRSVWLVAASGDATRPDLLATVDGVAFDGPTVVAVQFAGDRATLVVNGAALESVGVPAAGDATGVGLVAAGAAMGGDQPAFGELAVDPAP